jgi:hypothetical protein
MNVKYLLLSICLVILACGEKKHDASHEHATADGNPVVQQDTTRKSIPKEEHAQVGNAQVQIKYHAPAVRGRTIWGGLVPYGEVWVTGAHSATSLEIDQNFFVNEQEIPAGKYALFTIPDKENWIIIINKNWDQHLADEYDQKDDLMRISVKPSLLTETQERLKYAVVSTDATHGRIDISWEKLTVSLPFKVGQ